MPRLDTYDLSNNNSSHSNHWFYNMKVYAVWIISILKFMLRGRRFLLLSPPFLKKQYWYDRLSQKRFVTLNRNMTDWGVSWQVFLDDQFTPLENIFND